MAQVFDLGGRRGPRATLPQALELVDEVLELAGRLRGQLVDLDGRRRASSRTGYRSTTRYDGSGGAQVTGDGHTDPVGFLVAGEVDADVEDRGPVRRAFGEAVEATQAAAVLLRSAEGAAEAVLNPVRPAGPEDEGCTSHALHGFRGIPTRSPGGDLCRWCSDFWRRHRQRPSLADIQALEDRRIHREQLERRAA